jgi:threonylcarbamoyladenosine tRNA methylthiotransferase MtaB
LEKRVAFHNLGCKVNSYELDIMRQILRDEGFAEVSFQEEADIYVVNTCTVTNIADRKSRQMLHRAKKQNPQSVVIAVGCYVETDPARVEADDAIDLVIGNNKKTQIGQILRDFLEKREGLKEAAGKEGPKPSFREDLTCAPSFEEMHLTSPGHTRAYIKIQDGCNQFCSYCIIPFARGRIRSRARSEILREVRGLVAGGIREVVLTGIHVSSYGLDLAADSEEEEADTGRRNRVPGAVPFDPDRAGSALLGLLAELNAVEGLKSIRLSSLEPRIMTERFIAALSGLEKVCPHFHLSLQSGCDATLRRMNRHYTTAEYMQSVELLRKYYDRPAVTTDVIVGFPGETEEEFEATCAFLEEIRFYEIHVFRYSRRNGTAAAKMPNQVPESVKALRSDRLLAMTAAQAADFRAQFEGEEETILLEEICEHGGTSYWTGSTARYVTGAVPAGQLQQGGCGGALDPEPENLSGTLVTGSFSGKVIRLSRGDAMLFRVGKRDGAGDLGQTDIESAE